MNRSEYIANRELAPRANSLPSSTLQADALQAYRVRKAAKRRGLLSLFAIFGA